MKPMLMLFSAVILLSLVATGVNADGPAWTAYPADALKERQKRGKAPLVSTTAVKTDRGYLIVSDFGKDGEQIRCFDEFDESHQPTGKRSCWSI